MAEYNVTSFSEFYDRITNAGDQDVINCPENAVWDMNELDPTGSISKIDMYYGSYVHGNGTTLKNFHGYFQKANIGNIRKTYFDNFHVENMLATNAEPFERCQFSQCKISVQCGVGIGYLASRGIFLQCSLNIDAQAAGFRITDASLYGSGDDNYCKYCRIEVNAPNVTGTFPTYTNEYHMPGAEQYCELIYHVPTASGLQTGYQENCTIRGELTGVTEVFFRGSDQTVICMETMDNLDIETIAEENRKWLVTDDKLRDIGYLHDIGFVIGSE